MMTEDTLKAIQSKARVWLGPGFDEETRKKVKEMLEKNPSELTEAFYKDLEFGTGGLRGVMGAGTNRMNVYTVGMATQGLCNYLKTQFSAEKQIKVAIAHDSRNNSRLFAETAADIFSANDIKVYLFDSLRPTPELSFAIRYLKCHSGIVITASHNPKEFNGYKAYWNDGAQLIPPHDANVIAEIKKIKSIEEINFSGKKDLIEIIGDGIDEVYTDKIKSLSINPDVIKRNKDLKIVYTPIHGTGVKLVPMALRKMGFVKIYNVPEQDTPDGNFPTVKSPNPEETAAMNLAIQKAEQVNADLVMATDPDGDRVGVAVKNQEGKIGLLDGNQTATLLMYYLINQLEEKKRLKGNEYICKTIVTTDIIQKIAEDHKVKHFDVLTGFKYIAEIIRRKEDKMKFIGGGEESYGYLIGDFVRDKDAVISCAMIAEVTAWAKDQNKSLFDILVSIYLKYGFYKESLINVVRQGKEGEEEIRKMMEEFRNNPPDKINNSAVEIIHDYMLGKTVDRRNGRETAISLPKSNVIQFLLQDGSKISIRPSGTEPKIKFYFSVNTPLSKEEEYSKVNKKLEEKLLAIQKDMALI